ncbi:hypothetical protein GOP47_0021359 [Adiantum capillus-veneris]|uniref:Pentatricopeptide repeat-containing protein n=1 Tax=Adiantum capillus-veneris TaxID=13818 RepID=A0A9D4Z6V9_ADICA|nr:hypothetical protein GOP47_0021359 [Adiantum capillus-veneris]
MHEASCWLARIDRRFCRRFHDVNDDLRAVLNCHHQELHGCSSEGSQQEKREVIPCFADNPIMHDALQLSTSMEASLPCTCTETSISSLASLLRMCGDNGCITKGRQAHALLIEDGLEQHQDFQNPLFQLYAKCRAMEDAKDLFARMHCLSVVSWNVMISSYWHEGCEESAVQLFNRMQLQGLVPTKVTYICMLSGCASDEVLFTCKLMHARVSTSQFQSSTALHTALFNMYGRCGSIEFARRTFNNIEDRDVIAWNAMILVYHELELYEECYALFIQMQMEGFFPNKVTLVTMLDACTHLGASFEGRLMHRYAIDTGLLCEVSVATAVITMCGKGRSLEEAVSLFQSLYERDSILWNAMIALYSFHGRCRDALQMLGQMLLEGFVATRVTFASILNVCASRAAVFAGKRIHACIVHSEMEMDFDVANAIVNMYGKFCSTEYALCTFQQMPERDVTTWSAMISAFAEAGQRENAFQAFQEMQDRGLTPNEVTIVNVLRAFEAEADLNELRAIHGYILSHGFNEDMMVGTALVSLYGKCGDLNGARIVFDGLPKHDILSWTAMISSNVLNGEGREALLLFNRMKKEGVVPDRVAVANILAACSEIGNPSECDQMHAFIQLWRIELDEVVGSALVSMYGRNGRLLLSETLFNDLPKQQAATWNAMMVMYLQHGLFKKALKLFYEMCCNEVIPDKDSFVNSLTACANETSLINGEKVHALICNSALALNDVVAAALVNMYGKCGCPDIAKDVFDQMQSHGLILWNAMVGVHAQHGESMKALQTIYDMCSQSCVPDTITSISALNACSHTGLVNEGLHFVASMEHAYSISPAIDHYVCVTDMLGRLGRLREAELLINCMPFQPKAVSYMSLLGACQSLANMHQGERAAKCMSELASENAGPYVSLSNICVLQTNEAMGL